MTKEFILFKYWGIIFHALLVASVFAPARNLVYVSLHYHYDTLHLDNTPPMLPSHSICALRHLEEASPSFSPPSSARP